MSSVRDRALARIAQIAMLPLLASEHLIAAYDRDFAVCGCEHTHVVHAVNCLPVAKSSTSQCRQTYRCLMCGRSWSHQEGERHMRARHAQEIS